MRVLVSACLLGVNCRYNGVPKEDTAVKERIDTLHKRNLFKLELMPCFEP